MENWTRLTEDPLIISMGAAVVALLLILWFWIRRRRKGRDDLVKAKPSGVINDILSDYREGYPEFFFILDALSESNALSRLRESSEVEAALATLRKHQRARQKKSVSRKNVPLQLLPHEASRNERQIQAAMLTVLRAVYADEKLTRGLPLKAHAELDRLLDSLTA